MGEYRRNVTTAYRNHDFFRQDNEAAMVIRTNCAKHALEDVVLWLENGGGEVAVSLFYFYLILTQDFSINFFLSFKTYQLIGR